MKINSKQQSDKIMDILQEWVENVLLVQPEKAQTISTQARGLLEKIKNRIALDDSDTERLISILEIVPEIARTHFFEAPQLKRIEITLEEAKYIYKKAKQNLKGKSNSTRNAAVETVKFLGIDESSKDLDQTLDAYCYIDILKKITKEEKIFYIDNEPDKKITFREATAEDKRQAFDEAYAYRVQIEGYISKEAFQKRLSREIDSIRKLQARSGTKKQQFPKGILPPWWPKI